MAAMRLECTLLCGPGGHHGSDFCCHLNHAGIFEGRGGTSPTGSRQSSPLGDRGNGGDGGSVGGAGGAGGHGAAGGVAMSSTSVVHVVAGGHGDGIGGNDGQLQLPSPARATSLSLQS